MRIVVTGSRDAVLTRHRSIVHRVLDRLDPQPYFVGVGDATGVDAFTRDWCRQNLSPDDYKVFYADWDTHDRKAGPIRNREMLAAVKPDLVLAFLIPTLECRGTWDCIEAAQHGGYRIEPYRLR